MAKSQTWPLIQAIDGDRAHRRKVLARCADA